MDTDFSLILASRERIPLLRQFLQSVQDTTSVLSRLECFIAIDFDDNSTVCESGKLMREYPWLRFCYFNRQTNFTHYYNTIARLTSGSILWLLNDDVILTRKGWDTETLNRLEEIKKEFPDGAVALAGKDNLNAGYFCFPCMTRPAYSAAGYLVHVENTTSCQDIHHHGQWSSAGRLVYCPSLEVFHFSPCCGTRGNDAVHDRYRAISRNNVSRACMEGEGNRIRNILETRANS